MTRGWRMALHVISISKIKDINLMNSYAKFMIIEKINKASLPKQRSLLEHREDFWILRLETLSPKGLNISLNHPQDTNAFIW